MASDFAWSPTAEAFASMRDGKIREYLARYPEFASTAMTTTIAKPGDAKIHETIHIDGVPTILKIATHFGTDGRVMAMEFQEDASDDA
jgi:hypothetical protein